MTAFEGDLQEELVLRFSHNVLEHLGLKLYQNKPTNVLAELVSNSWDAYANNVWIDISNRGHAEIRGKFIHLECKPLL